MKRNWRWIVGIVAVLGLATWGFWAATLQPLAPDVSFTTLQDQKIDLAALRGRVVVVNFWATSCSTCIAEMPDMAAAYRKFAPQGLAFIAVAMSYDTPEYVRNFAHTRQLPFDVAFDTHGKLAQAFGEVKMTPTTFVIGKDGRVLKSYLGRPDPGEFGRILQQALAA